MQFPGSEPDRRTKPEAINVPIHIIGKNAVFLSCSRPRLLTFTSITSVGSLRDIISLPRGLHLRAASDLRLFCHRTQSCGLQDRQCSRRVHFHDSVFSYNAESLGGLLPRLSLFYSDVQCAVRCKTSCSNRIRPHTTLAVDAASEAHSSDSQSHSSSVFLPVIIPPAYVRSAGLALAEGTTDSGSFVSSR